MNKHSMPSASGFVFPPPGSSPKAPLPPPEHLAQPPVAPEPILPVAWVSGAVIALTIGGGLAYVSNLYVQEIGRVVAFGLKLGALLPT